MLGKPIHGWSTITIEGQEIGRASDIDFMPYDTLLQCYNYLSHENDNFQLSFDGEDNWFGLVEINYGLYAYKDNGNVSIIFDDIAFDYATVKDYVKKLTLELISDIEANPNEWYKFCYDTDIEFVDYEKKVEQHKKELDELIAKVKPLCENINNHQMELCNLLFGHSRGNYPIPDREKFQDIFYKLLDCGFDSYGYIANKELEKKYGKVKTSEYTNKEIYPIDSNPVKEEPDYHPQLHYFDNVTFMLNPYYWGDAPDLMEFPNFIYYPENLELKFYKYPLRDSYSNKELTEEYFVEIINKCIESLKETEND